MDARRFLIETHAHAHLLDPSEEWEKPISDTAWAKIGDAMMREAPAGHTSVAWLVWHMARLEDMGVNAAVRCVPEIYDREEWSDRLGVDSRQVGSLMSEEEVLAFTGRVDTRALMQYRDAVGRGTRSWLESSDLGLLESPIPEAGERIASTGDFPDQLSPWARSFFANRTGGWIVIRLAIWHNFMHLGHVEHVIHTLGVD